MAPALNEAPHDPTPPAPADRYAIENWRGVLQKTRNEKQQQAVKTLLQHWRQRTWVALYSRQPFGPRGILPDTLISTLTGRTTYRTIEDLRKAKWLFADRHGPEVLAIMEQFDMGVALKELQALKARHEKEVAVAREKEEKRKVAERQRAEREREREHKRLRREVDAAQRRQEVAEKRRRQDKQQAARTNTPARNVDDVRMVIEDEGSGRGSRGKKRKAEGDVLPKRGKWSHADKENGAYPPALEAQSGMRRPPPKPRPRFRRPACDEGQTQPLASTSASVLVTVPVVTGWQSVRVLALFLQFAHRYSPP